MVSTAAHLAATPTGDLVAQQLARQASLRATDQLGLDERSNAAQSTIRTDQHDVQVADQNLHRVELSVSTDPAIGTSVDVRI